MSSKSPCVTAFLKQQDPLEKFYGRQHERRGVNENQSVAEFFQNTQALSVIDSTCASLRGMHRERRGRHLMWWTIAYLQNAKQSINNFFYLK